MLALGLNLGIVEPKTSLQNEVDLGHLVLWLLKFQPHIVAHLILASIQLDYDFVNESSIEGIEEETEVLHELLEYGVYNLGLHLGAYLLVEVKLFHNQVVVGSECKLNIVNDVLVQSHGHVDVADDGVGLLKFLDPQIHLIKLFSHHAIEVLLGLHEWR